MKGLPLVSQSKLASPAEECPKGRVQQGELRFCPAGAGFFAHLAFPWCELIIFGIKNQTCAWPLEHKEPRPLFFFCCCLFLWSLTAPLTWLRVCRGHHHKPNEVKSSDPFVASLGSPRGQRFSNSSSGLENEPRSFPISAQRCICKSEQGPRFSFLKGSNTIKHCTEFTVG